MIGVLIVNKMILFISKYYNNRSGAAQSGLDVVRSISKSYNKISLLYIKSYNKKLIKECDSLKNLSIEKSPIFQPRIGKNISSISKYLESILFDKYRIKKIKKLNSSIVIANSLSSQIIAQKICQQLNLKSCIIIRESPQFYSNPKITIKRILFFDHIIFVSKNVMEDWSQYSKKLKSKSTYIPNTIYNENIPKILKQKKIHYRKKLGFKEDRFIISIIGKFMNRKNQQLIFNNIKKLKSINKKIQFIFIGKYFNSYGLKMKKKLSKNDGNFIHMIGHKKNILEYIYGSDCLLVTSKSEASPRVIYESMILKTPVIASEIDGIPELVQHNKTGLLFSNNNIEEMCNQIDILINSGISNRLTDEASKLYNKKFSNQNHENQYKEFLSGIITENEI